MNYLWYIAHILICSFSPVTVLAALWYANQRVLLLLSTMVLIIFYSEDSKFELTLSSVCRSIIAIILSQQYSKLVKIIPNIQSILLFDMLGFGFSFLSSVLLLEQSNMKSDILSLVNFLICLFLHRNYIKFSLVFGILSLANNLLFKYRNGNKDFIFSSFIWTLIFNIIQITYYDLPSFSIKHLMIDLWGMFYIVVYITSVVAARITYIYTLKYNTTSVINFIRVLKTVLVALLIEKKVNLLSVFFSISCFISII